MMAFTVRPSKESFHLRVIKFHKLFNTMATLNGMMI